MTAPSCPLDVERPECSPERFPTQPLTACFVRNLGTPSRNAYALTVDQGEATGAGAQNDDCAIRLDGLQATQHKHQSLAASMQTAVFLKASGKQRQLGVGAP